MLTTTANKIRCLKYYHEKSGQLHLTSLYRSNVIVVILSLWLMRVSRLKCTITALLFRPELLLLYRWLLFDSVRLRGKAYPYSWQGNLQHESIFHMPQTSAE